MRRGVTVSKGPYSGPPSRRASGSVTRVIGLTVVGLIIAAAFAFLLDLGSRVWAESFVSAQIQRALLTNSSPSVSFGGALFLPELFTGNLDSAEVRVDDFEVEGISFAGARLHLEDVTFSPVNLVLHRPSTIVAHDGRGELRMTADQLTDAFQGQGVPLKVRFDTEGNVRVSTARLPVTVAVTVEAKIDSGKLVLTPVRLRTFSFVLNLPEFVPGVTYTEVEFEDQLGTLHFTLHDSSFEVQGSAGA